MRAYARSFVPSPCSKYPDFLHFGVNQGQQFLLTVPVHVGKKDGRQVGNFANRPKQQLLHGVGIGLNGVKHEYLDTLSFLAVFI